MSYHRYLDALDECEAIAYDFIEQQIGRERFEELQQELEDNGTSELKDVAWEIMEQVSSLFKTPQEQFDNCPYSLGDEDFQPSKNFYSPKDFSKPLGVIDDE